MVFLLAHGSRADFDAFDLSYCTRNSMGRGFYFTSDIAMAQLYAGGRDPLIARVHVGRPYEIDSHEATTAEVRAWSRIFSFEDAREQLIDRGFDGVVFREGSYLEVVAFHPEQIESMGRHPSFEAAGASVGHLQPA